MCHTIFALSLANLTAYFRSKFLAENITNQNMTIGSIIGSNIAANYHNLVMQAMDWKATHLLTLEDDMGFYHDVLHILYSRDLDWVGANYPTRCDKNPSYTAVAIEHDRRVRTDEDSAGVEAAAYTGFGCTLFKMSMFEKIEQPWFMMAYMGENQYTTQDCWLGEQCRQAGISAYVDHDVSKKVWHIGNKDYTCLETARRIPIHRHPKEHANDPNLQLPAGDPSNDCRSVVAAAR